MGFDRKWQQQFGVCEVKANTKTNYVFLYENVVFHNTNVMNAQFDEKSLISGKSEISLKSGKQLQVSIEIFFELVSNYSFMEKSHEEMRKKYMLFYCLDFAYDDLKNTAQPTWNRDGHNLFTWHVMLVPMEELAHLYFVNDASGFTIILRYGIEDDIIVDYEIFRKIVSKFMKELELPVDLVEYYFSMFPKFDVSAYYHEKHMEEIIDWLLKNKEQLLDSFDHNVFTKRDAMIILNNSNIEKWFGDVIYDTPINIMERLLGKELDSVREYYASNK